MKEEQNIPVSAGSETAFLQQISQFALANMNQSADARQIYHRYSLAARTAVIAAELADSEAADPDVRTAAVTAAWLHLIGFSTDYLQANQQSRKLAGSYLRNAGLDSALAELVDQCLEVLQTRKANTNPAVAIFRDAYFAARYGAGFQQEIPLLRLEMEFLGNQRLSDAAWSQLQLQELLGVKYQTASAKANYDGHLASNILEQKKQVDRNRHKVYVDQEEAGLEKYGQIERKVPTSGIQTFFRTNYRNHINLSSIADNKANIMISVNAILISVLISIISYKNITETNPMILMPVVIFLVTGLSSLIFAVLSARPKVTTLNAVDQSPEEARKNIVFFGNFVQMDVDAFEEALDAVFRDSELLYGNMTRDLYYLGKVLDKKYRYLTLSYNIFMIGFVATVITFMIALLT
ncbi:MAG: hypothetical protein KDC34_06810 [Saprospiraceae bacterium]|nr:hypothetical protein [Saprospiraceae bacterium]